MSSEEPSASRRYKDILAEITEAAGVLREQDRKKAVELRASLITREDEMLRTGTRARVTAAVTRLHWERALDLLWAESWMQLRPHPEPDPRADPERLDDYDAAVQRCSDALHDLIRRRWYDVGRG